MITVDEGRVGVDGRRYGGWRAGEGSKRWTEQGGMERARKGGGPSARGRSEDIEDFCDFIFDEMGHGMHVSTAARACRRG